jgi:hypothetical protein
LSVIIAETSSFIDANSLLISLTPSHLIVIALPFRNPHT